MNISQFVFRDVNRNGIYDLGEPPFAGVRMRLEQDGHEPIVRESNLSGFANFPMSADDQTKDITAAGPVRFVAQVPDGMLLTTGNPVQEATIVAMPMAPGGFAMEPPNPFVGLAPELTIESNAAGLASMSCSKGQVTIAATNRGEKLVCSVKEGTWTVEWRKADGTVPSREVTLDRWPVHLPVSPVKAAAGTNIRLDFDDLLNTENILELPSFGGLQFHNFVVAHRKKYGGWGYVNGTVSGEFSVYNSSGHPATITAEKPFGLVRVFVAVAWPSARQAPVRFTALRSGVVVDSETLLASNLEPILFEPQWQGIDELVIGHDAYWQVVLDDMELTR